MKKLLIFFLLVVLCVSIAEASFTFTNIVHPNSCDSGDDCSVTVNIKNTGNSSASTYIECGIYSYNALHQVVYQSWVSASNCYPSEEFVKTIRASSFSPNATGSYTFTLKAPNPDSKIGSTNEPNWNYDDNFMVKCTAYTCCSKDADAYGICPNTQKNVVTESPEHPISIPLYCSGFAVGTCKSGDKPLYCNSLGSWEDNCNECGCDSGFTCNPTTKLCDSSLKCSDGTMYSQCSNRTKGLFCDNGNLINYCSRCGCSLGSECDRVSEMCSAQGCTDGTARYSCSMYSIGKRCTNPPTLTDECVVCSCAPGQDCDSLTGRCTGTPYTCSDGTSFSACSSANKPKYCNSNGNLTNDCSLCSCPSGQYCSLDGKTCSAECVVGDTRVCISPVTRYEGTQTCSSNGKWGSCITGGFCSSNIGVCAFGFIMIVLIFLALVILILVWLFKRTSNRRRR